MLADDLTASSESIVETLGDRPQHLAMPPPDLGRVPIVVALVDDGMELHVETAVEHRIDEIVLFDEALDPLKLGNVGVGGHPDEPTRQCWFDERADLVDVADEVVIDRPDAGTAIGR